MVVDVAVGSAAPAQREDTGIVVCAAQHATGDGGLDPSCPTLLYAMLWVPLCLEEYTRRWAQLYDRSLRHNTNLKRALAV